MPNVNVTANPMTQPIDRLVLVYEDSNGQEVTQFATELTGAGTAIDPETDEDMELVGFRVIDKGKDGVK